MLSTKEKKEMLNDAASEQRRIAFRKAQVGDFDPSFDAYLKFLADVQKVFSKAQAYKPTPFGTNFKL
ncbi:MAG: hypothetical protein A2Z88_07050 [Omnitrophica WOR_2 bacterium GWA2_47_8]|nr:MAG: hypothetical protein A2Z88_07050 [Omnitrophica WOR_2 bacterium GWA2_47_8]